MVKTFPALLTELSNVTAFVESELEKADCPMKTQMSISVCVEEVFVNIAHYAYPDKVGTAEVRVDVSPDEKSVVICFLDNGIPFDPLNKTEPDVSLPVEQREIGGLGIFMVKKLSDELSYEYADGWNVLTMKKFF